MTLYFWLVVLVVVLADFAFTAWDMGRAEFNGIGAIPKTRARTAFSPMRQRVLAAWLLGWIPNLARGVPARLWAYLAFKAFLIAGSLCATFPLLGMKGTLLLALFMVASNEFDYWSSYAEIACLGLCMYGDPWIALGASIVWGMSRETVVLAPVIAFLAGGYVAGMIACAGVLVFLFVNLYQGKAPRYCPWNLFRVHNVPDLAGVLRGDFRIYASIVMCIAFLLVAVFADLPPWAEKTWPVGLFWVISGWTVGRAREMRVFLPLVLWIAGGV